MTKEVKQHHCYKCGGSNIEYKTIVFDDIHGCFPYICTDCGYKGEECYILEYAEAASS